MNRAYRWIPAQIAGIALLAVAVLPSPAPAAERETDRRRSANSQRDSFADGQRIRLDHARRARTSPQPPPSLLSQAAGGAVLAEAPPAPLVGSLGDDRVQPTQYWEDSGIPCGPVCDCPSCGVEAGCGVDIGCGVEPGCGYEVGCGIEPGCGYEVGCGVDVVDDCSCDACAPHAASIPLFLPLLRVSWCRFDFFAGVQGFKGPMNFANTGNRREGSGSFGFYQGFNEGRSLRRWFGWDMAAQLGVRATQSNLSGASFTDETRHQVFVTGGLFRRVDYGLQYGMVVDYLNDDWYFQGDLVQLRGELSWRGQGCHVCGVQFMAGVNDDTSTTTVRDGAGGIFNATVDFEPTDQYRIFYRRLLKHRGQWDAFAGWTDNDDGLLGASLNLPLRRNLALSTGATYLIPNEGTSSGGHEEESWNLSLGLIWRPGGPTGCGRYCRPLFDVADNGTFLVDRR